MSKPQNQHTKYTLITFAIMEKKMNVHCIYINSAEKIQHLNILYFQIDKNICQWYNFSCSHFFILSQLSTMTKLYFNQKKLGTASHHHLPYARNTSVSVVNISKKKSTSWQYKLNIQKHFIFTQYIQNMAFLLLRLHLSSLVPLTWHSRGSGPT